MDVFITLFYILFTFCIIYPPTEFVSAGFTIPQLLDNYLGSENTNFISYHMKRITVTAFIHSVLPLGYIFSLWCGGIREEWMICAVIGMLFLPLFVSYTISCWWEGDQNKHPVVKALLPYVTEGSDWRVVASNFNTEFRSVDKVSIPLNTNSKFVATETWLVKVTLYGLYLIKQSECALVATATDSHSFSTSGEDEVQYVNIEAIPARDEVKKFTFRISTVSLRDLQPRLDQPIRVPEHTSLLPTLVERFVTVFKQYVEQNPVYYVDQELELCIGCMQNTADVKINKRCVAQPINEEGPPPCQQCNCRVLWCTSCMARWWATRAPGAPASWLATRGSCPVCRAAFCMLDVCPARAPAQQ